MRMGWRVCVMSKAEAYYLDYMLAVLGFRFIQRKWVGFQQTVQTFARYERLRQQGLSRSLAIERVLYG